MGKSLAKNEGQGDNNKAVTVKESAHALTAAEFHRLSEVPPAIEWFANIRNEKTRRAYMYLCNANAINFNRLR